MTVAHDRADLHRLVDQLTPEQAQAVREVVALFVFQARAVSAEESAWPPSWFGAIQSDRSDVAARSEDILRAEFGQSTLLPG